MKEREKKRLFVFFGNANDMRAYHITLCVAIGNTSNCKRDETKM